MKQIAFTITTLVLAFQTAAQIAPTIVAQPTNQTVFSGASPSIAVTVSGTGPFTFQWRFNGADIPLLITTIAGNGMPGYFGDGGAATNAHLDYPSTMTPDGKGNVIIADTADNRLRKIDTNGMITLFAGNGNGYSGDGGQATNAGIGEPYGVAADRLGNIFMTADSRVRKIATNGTISTVAANLGFLYGVAVDGAGNVFVANLGDNCVRKIDHSGNVSTVAGNGAAGFAGDGGPATSAELDSPQGVAVDFSGNLYIADSYNCCVRRVGTNGVITTVAGAPTNFYFSDRFVWEPTGAFSGDNGPATNAELNGPAGVAVDGIGSLFIADCYNNRIRKVDASGTITTVAGDDNFPFSGDGGPATNANLSLPGGVAVDNLGNLLIADSGHNRIREVLAQGPTLVITNAGAFNSGNYDVVITGAHGSVTSSVAALTVLSAPAFARQPGDQAAELGGSATFAPQVIGTMPFAFQWYFAGTPLPGRTGGTLEITSASFADAGEYTVVVTNVYGSVTSSPAALAVGYSPALATQPASQIGLAGGEAVLMAPVSGTGPFAYQWQLNGTNIPPIINTIAGNGTYAYSGDGGPAIHADVNTPYGVATDAHGNLFFADYGNHRIRCIRPDGVIITVAGSGTADFSGDGGAATNASLNLPAGVALDSAGNLFIADYGNNRIRRVDANGVITTMAGGGAGGDGGAATNAALNKPISVAVDELGNLLIADTGNNRIRKVDARGIVSTVGGNGVSGYSGDGGAATNASLSTPFAVAPDADGGLLILDTGNNRLRKVDPNGIITTIAGTGIQGYYGDGRAATIAELDSPSSIVRDGFGNIFIADFGNQRIRRISVDGTIRSVAGTGSAGYSGDGGSPTNAALCKPFGLAFDLLGNLIISDSANDRLRRVATAQGPGLAFSDLAENDAGNYQVIVASPYGSVTSAMASLTLVLPIEPSNQGAAVGGNAGFSVPVLGPEVSYQWYFAGAPLPGQTHATLNLTGLRLSDAGNYEVVVTNSSGSVTSGIAVLAVGFAPAITAQPTNESSMVGGNSSFSVTVSGTGPFTYQWQLNGTNLPLTITTIAGNGTQGYSGDGGPAIAAELNDPCCLAVDTSGNVFFSDDGNNRVRKIGTNGVLTTVAGTGSANGLGDYGAATNAGLNSPYGVAVDSQGNLFIADYYSGARIRRVDTNGIITTVAGGGPGGDGGAATNAALNQPVGVSLDGLGDLFVADSGHNVIRKVDANGVISTIAGNYDPYIEFYGDGGAATNANLGIPLSLASDAFGNVLIADYNNNRIRKVDTNGIITTVAGNGSTTEVDGVPATESGLYNPVGLALDASGDFLFVELSHIRKVDTNGIISTVAGGGAGDDGSAATNASLSAPFGVAVDAAGNLFIADAGHNRVREVAVQGPVFHLNPVGASNAGNYSVVVTSPYGSVTSSVVALEVTLPPLRAMATVNRVGLQLSGPPGQNYILQAATSLNPPINWQPVFTNAADANGNWSFTNQNVGTRPQLFYRVTIP